MKMKSVFCLSCGKKISSKSRFCRYCGELQKKSKNQKKELVWTCDFCEKEFSSKKKSDKHELSCSLNPKNNKFPYNTNPKRVWVYLWISTLIAFVISTFISARFVDQNITLMNRTVLLVIYFANILIGIISFILIPFSSKKVHGKKNSFLVKYSVFLCILYLLISPAIFALEGFRAKDNEEYRKKFYTNSALNIHPSPTPTYSSLKSDLLMATNKYRQDQKLDTLTLDGDLCEVAKRLVSKISTLDGVINSGDYIDLCPTCSQIGINSGKGISADEILKSWKESTDIKVKNNLIGKYKYGCADTIGNDYVFVFANKNTSTQQNTSNTNTNSTNNSGSVECVGPDGKHFQTTMDECTKLNQQWGKAVDYMVNCTLPSECGGGVKRIAKSECDKPCTRITNDSTSGSSNSGSGGNKVQYTTTEGIVDGTYYCYENRVNELTRMEQYIKLKTDTAELCTLSYKPTLDSCVNDCNQNPDYSACIKPCYDKANEACISKYTEVGDLRKELWNMVSVICP